MIEYQPKIEQKETKPPIDFVKIFKERLDSFPTASEEIKQNLPWELKDVKKIATALICAFENTFNWNIWIENFTKKTLELKYNPYASVHVETKVLLERFMRQKTGNSVYDQFDLGFPISAFITQDTRDKISLLIEEDKAQTLINTQKSWEKDIISLYDNYNLDNIIGAFDFDRKSRTFGKVEKNLNSPNIVGKIKELQYYKNFRQYHPMSNTQYARWLTASKTKKQGQTNEDVWQKIIAMDKTEDPTRRPDREPLAD